MSIVHLAYTVPRSDTYVRRGIDKFIEKSGLPPLHRPGWDALIPWKHPIRAPHSISYHLLHKFKKLNDVKYYSMYEKRPAILGKGDIFIGAPLPAGGYSHDTPPTHNDPLSIVSQTFNRYSSPDNRRYLVMPYANDPRLVSWVKDLVVSHADGVILIGSDRWTRNWENGAFNFLARERVLQVNMAIDTAEYPRIKKNFNPPGKRKYLYIGHTGWYKNVAELERLASQTPGFQGAHIGIGNIPGWKKIADFASLSPSFMKEILHEYDIFVTTSTADAQATTILEQMSFGMAIACTPESGYEYDSIERLSTHDTGRNVETLLRLQNADENELLERALKNRELLKKHHSWETFCDSISSFINLH